MEMLGYTTEAPRHGEDGKACGPAAQKGKSLKGLMFVGGVNETLADYPDPRRGLGARNRVLDPADRRLPEALFFDTPRLAMFGLGTLAGD